MADSWKSMDLSKLIINDDMIDYVLEKYENNCQLDDAIGDEILDDLLKREWEKQQRVKDDKRKVTRIKILDDLEQRIENVEKHLNKAKEKMDLNKRKEKMVMEREVIIIESDTSSDHNPFQVTYNESSDDNPFQFSTDESFDHNPFQLTSDESTDDTLKSSPRIFVALMLLGNIKASKGKPWSSSTSAATTKLENPKSRSRSKHLLVEKISSSKHLAPRTPKIGSTSTTLHVPTKRPPPVRNYALGLATVKTWQQILNKEFKIKKAKKDVG
ncbi:hypothetical protein Tco_0270196 [Tanacetum coccineum]